MAKLTSYHGSTSTLNEVFVIVHQTLLIHMEDGGFLLEVRDFLKFISYAERVGLLKVVGLCLAPNRKLKGK
jgi:hypothetical protein